jgi:acetyltransferase
MKKDRTPQTDFFHSHRPPLDAFFQPRAIAVIGATEREGTVGRTVLWNLLRFGFKGNVYPVNAKYESVLGAKSYPSLSAIEEKIDLAVIITPAKTVPGIIRECVEKGVQAAIIISAGFKEVGAEGARLEREIMTEAKGKIRIIGPNCFGVMNPSIGLNATFAADSAEPGSVGFITQSGALASAILDWSFREKVGYSKFVSVGSMLDVNWGDLISYLGDDPQTESILVYMESVGDAHSFLSAAREVSFVKPIIVIKPGRTPAASRAAASHTGALAGSDEVLDAAFRRTGVVRVKEISELFYLSELLSKQPRPKGPKLSILTNAGGPGVIATDALILNGGKLTELSTDTMKRLNEFLPAAWSHGNPVDILGDANPETYSKALEVLAQDPNSDGLLVILAPQAMTSPTSIAERLAPYAHTTGKPVIACWMGGRDVEPGIALLNNGQIPTFAYPDTAAKMFNYMWRYTYNLRGLYETPVLPSLSDPYSATAKKDGEALINSIRKSGRSILSEYESKKLLHIYGIPTVDTLLAQTADEAIEQAEKIGYPVVLKLHSEKITHKTDVGGVKLNLANADAVRKAFDDIKRGVTAKSKEPDAFLGVTVQPMVKLEGYELIIGSSIDEQFGPVLLFGTGGQLVEVFRDRALALPPLTTTLARRMMEQTVIYNALKGVRGRAPVDLASLEGLLVRFSDLVVEQPWIKEIDINPLLASHERLIALDARVILHSADMKEKDLPKPSIRPYPVQYISHWKTKKGEEVTFRPIRPEDEVQMVEFHKTLSERSVQQFFKQPLTLGERVAHDRLARICFPDYDREIAFVATTKDEKKNTDRIMAAGRLSKISSDGQGELGILVSDPFQKVGVGTECIKQLIHIGKEEQLHTLRAHILEDNNVMLTQCKKLGFKLSQPDNGMVLAEITL